MFIKKCNNIYAFGYEPKIVRYDSDDEICSQCGHIVHHGEVEKTDEGVEFTPERNTSVQNNPGVQNNLSSQNIQNTSLDTLVQKLVNAFVQILSGLFPQLQSLLTNANASSSANTSQNSSVSQNNKSYSMLNQESAELEKNIIDISNKRLQLTSSFTIDNLERCKAYEKELEQQQYKAQFQLGRNKALMKKIQKGDHSGIDETTNKRLEQFENEILKQAQLKQDYEKEMLSISNKRQELACQMTKLIGPNFNSDPRVAQLQAQDQEYELKLNQYEVMYKAALSNLRAYENKRTELLNSLV